MRIDLRLIVHGELLLLDRAAKVLDRYRSAVSIKATTTVEGGNVEAAGNQTRFSEFNAWCDPEALATVLAAEIPTEMIGLDVTRKLIMKGNEVERLAQPWPWLHDALRFYVEFHKKQEGLDGAVINDVLAIAYLIQPDVLTFSDLRLSVDLDDGQRRGRTKLDAKGSFTRVAMDVHPAPVRRMLFERVLPAGAPAEEALGQLDWCVSYLQSIRKPGIAKVIEQNRSQIRREMSRFGD